MLLIKFISICFPSSDINPQGKYVLITGCDSGFGNALAIELDKRDFNVLAGVFSENSRDLLANLGPSTAAYGASKYALESFSDCLRREMSVSGNNAIMKMAENPNEVIEALQHAVMNTRSKVRYRPGWQSSLLFFPLSMCPVWLVDFLMDMGHDKRVISADVRKQLID
ncbi:unnamed protein product [Rotaria sp. Silwood1]|nr:unnamed protein product [Rotaria sp. Silwood1]